VLVEPRLKALGFSSRNKHTVDCFQLLLSSSTCALTPWFGNNSQRLLAAGGDGNGGGDNNNSTNGGGGGGGPDVSGVVDPADVQGRGAACASCGEHADAVGWFTHGLALLGSAAAAAAGVETKSIGSSTMMMKSQLQLRLHVSRAEERQHLGLLRPAIDDYTAALGLLTQGGGGEEGEKQSGLGHEPDDSRGDGDDGNNGGDGDGAAATTITLDTSAVMLARGRCQLQLEDYAAAREAGPGE